MFPSKVVQQLLSSKKVAVLTGAGISVESGISTFRGEDGLWDKVDPLKVATPEAFARDPKAVWEWYEARRRQIAQAEPNRGHEVIAWMEEFFPEFALITQNVDRLHQKAGSRHPIELHGSLWMVRCTGNPSCGEWEDRYELIKLPPKCPQCGSFLRPSVVWFGEGLSPETWEEAEKAAKSCDTFFVIGTSALVYPAAALLEAAILREKMVIEINPEKTSLSDHVTLSIRSKAGEALESLQGALLENQPRAGL